MVASLPPLPLSRVYPAEASPHIRSGGRVRGRPDRGEQALAREAEERVLVGADLMEEHVRIAGARELRDLLKIRVHVRAGERRAAEVLRLGDARRLLEVAGERKL